MSDYLEAVQAELEAIKAANRYRDVTGEIRTYTADFSTNDYLALAADSRMVEALRQAKRVGSGGARLLGGRHREHLLLEEDLARWLRRERALLFSSGYLAALGAIAVLAPLVDTIYSDALNHASLIDGIRSSKTPCRIYPHAQLPPKNQRRGRSLIVSESFFGMDGDLADLPAILHDMGGDDVLLVDEAHALGVFGENGAGCAAVLDDPRVVVLCTLSKAIGASGGAIAGPACVIDLLVNTARTFIFDTAPPPALAFAARIGVLLAQNAADRRERLFGNVDRLRGALAGRGLPALGGRTPIVPVVLGSEERALDAMHAAAKLDVCAPAVRPPTVAPGSSRLRISLRSDHTSEQIDLLLEALFMHRYFVTGTDTDIGKTRVTASLAAALRAGGERPTVVKVVQTGLAPGVPGDAAVAGRLANVRHVELARFRKPADPWSAAIAEPAPPVRCEDVVSALASIKGAVVVEGAGGLAVPLNERQNFTAVVDAAQLRVVLVVGLRLGCINHALLTLAMCEQQRLAVAGCVLSDRWRNAEPGYAADVARVLQGKTDIFGILPFDPDESAAVQAGMQMFAPLL